MQAHALPVPDSPHPLALCRYLPPPAKPPQASVVIGAAFGVPQSFYAPFAQWLAGQGYAVATFDYRGQGESLQGRLRDVRADLWDWVRDYDAVVAHATAALPGRPLFLIGHSLGAQLPGLLGAPERIQGLLSVAAGSGYWRDNAPRIRRAMPLFWHVLVPLAVRLCGYFPGRRLRTVGDLPAGVALQWRRWCLDPQYSVGAEGEAARARYEAVRFPLHAWFIEDDELMTWRATQALAGLYAQAPCQLERIAPPQAPARRIGHLGFFRPEFREVLWPRVLAPLQRFAQHATPAQGTGVAGTTAR